MSVENRLRESRRNVLMCFLSWWGVSAVSIAVVGFEAAFPPLLAYTPLHWGAWIFYDYRGRE